MYPQTENIQIKNIENMSSCMENQIANLYKAVLAPAAATWERLKDIIEKEVREEEENITEKKMRKKMKPIHHLRGT